MGTIFSYLVLIFFAYSIQNYLVKKFGRKIKNRLILVSFPTIYIVGIIFYFFTSKKINPPDMYVAAPLSFLFKYFVFVLLPSIAFFKFMNYVRSGGLKKDYNNTFGELFYEIGRGFKYFVTNPIKDPTGHQSWLWTLSKIISLVLTPVVIYFIYEGYLILYQLFGDFVVNYLKEQTQDFRLTKNPFFYIIGFVWFCIIIFWIAYGLLCLIGGLFRIISLFIFNLLK